MARRPNRSAQTVAVLEAMVLRASHWQYGYDLARRTGLRSGTLYPILARLADHGHLDRQWEAEPAAGRPPRHLYRLTGAGQSLAREVLAERAGAPPSRVTFRGSARAGGTSFVALAEAAGLGKG